MYGVGRGNDEIGSHIVNVKTFLVWLAHLPQCRGSRGLLGRSLCTYMLKWRFVLLPRNR